MDKALSSLFWNAEIKELKKGCVYHGESRTHICLICGASFKDGRIYKVGDELFDAGGAVVEHVMTQHPPVIEYLLGLDRRYSGFTDHQKEVLKRVYSGASDKEIASAIGTTTSTVRNYRFTFREKEKQAKLMLTVLELVREGREAKDDFIDFPQGSVRFDARFAVTEREYREIIAAYFPDGRDGPLASFPNKEKKRLAVLKHISTRFKRGKSYTEKEVNEELKKVYADYALLRRYLIDYGFLSRTPDGGRYWSEE